MTRGVFWPTRGEVREKGRGEECDAVLEERVVRVFVVDFVTVFLVRVAGLTAATAAALPPLRREVATCAVAGCLRDAVVFLVDCLVAAALFFGADLLTTGIA